MKSHPCLEKALAAGVGLLVIAALNVACEDWTRVEIDSSDAVTPAPAAENPTPPDAPPTTNDPGTPSTPSSQPPESLPAPPPSADLPTNPQIPASTPGSNDQLWYFSYKTHDNTFRIRWPTYFYTVHRVGPGSYTLVNGLRANFRSYDTDYGAMRPSYSLPGPFSRLPSTVICVLYTSGGQALAWFSTKTSGINQGTLP